MIISGHDLHLLNQQSRPGPVRWAWPRRVHVVWAMKVGETSDTYQKPSNVLAEDFLRAVNMAHNVLSALKKASADSPTNGQANLTYDGRSDVAIGTVVSQRIPKPSMRGS